MGQQASTPEIAATPAVAAPSVSACIDIMSHGVLSAKYICLYVVVNQTNSFLSYYDFRSPQNLT